MRTTVEIPDCLLRRAREFAARNGIPFREVVERALEAVLRDDGPAARRYRLKTVTTRGSGLVGENDWAKIRSLIYEDRGG